MGSTQAAKPPGTRGTSQSGKTILCKGQQCPLILTHRGMLAAASLGHVPGVKWQKRDNESERSRLTDEDPRTPPPSRLFPSQAGPAPSAHSSTSLSLRFGSYKVLIHLEALPAPPNSPTPIPTPQQALLMAPCWDGSTHLQRIPGLQLDNSLSDCQLLSCGLQCDPACGHQT